MARTPSKKAAATTSRRDEIIDVAAQVIAERGIKGATVRDIGQAAGILSGSLYYHFDSKEQIVLELLLPSVQASSRVSVVHSGRQPRVHHSERHSAPSTQHLPHPHRRHAEARLRALAPTRTRHTAASLMSEAGITIATIADQLGHDETRMTLLIYRHATKPTVSAGNAMTRYLEQPT